METKVRQRDEGELRLPSRGSGVSARAIDSELRTPILADGIFGANGIPSSVEGRREAQKKSNRRRWKMKKCLLKYPLTTSWFLFCLTLGVFFQGWFHV